MKSFTSIALLSLSVGAFACGPKPEAKEPSQTEATASSQAVGPHDHGGGDHGPEKHAGMQQGMHQGDHGSMHDHMQSHMAEQCPMSVPGATVSATDTPTGVALTFTTEGDVVTLQKRVASMAEHQQKMADEHKGMMHSQMGGQAGGTGSHQHGQSAGADQHQHGDKPQDCMGEHCAGMHGKPIEKATQVVNVEKGAQLLYTPTDSADLAALREHVKKQAQAMQKGECPMMHDCPMMQGHGKQEHDPQGAAHDHGTSSSAAH